MPSDHHRAPTAQAPSGRLPWWRRVPGPAWAAAGLFGAVGLFAFSVGLLDVLSAATLQYKLVGFAFAVAGLALFTGSAGLLRTRWRATHGRIASIAAGVAGAFVGVYLLMLQSGAPALAPSRLPPFPSWAPWAALVVASVAGAVLGWWSTNEYADYQVKWAAVSKRLVAGGLSVTVIFAGVQWWYTQQYQPNTIAAALTVTTELEPANGEGETPDPHLFKGTITVKNVTDTKVQVIASLYQITKVTHAARSPVNGLEGFIAERQAVACFFEELAPVTNPECDGSGIRRYGHFSAGDPQAQDDFPIFRASQQTTVEMLQLGQIMGDGSWLEPDEEFQSHVLVHAPEEPAEASRPSDLRTLQLSAQLTVAQGSRLVLERDPEMGHDPEMVPEALMSNEEYHDYKQADEDVYQRQADGDVYQPKRDAASCAQSDVAVAQETEEVDREDRERYFLELAACKPLDEGSLDVSELGTTPRFYPHRYTVAESRVSDVSTLHRLVSGSQAVDTVLVLSQRTYNPVASGLMEYESSDMVTCISPAGTLTGRSKNSEIRRDPTAVCPGAWYSLAGHEDYAHRYRAMADYREEMAAFYGLVGTGAVDVVSLTTEAEAASATVADSSPVHHIPGGVFRACELRLQVAGAVTDAWMTVQQAFDRHASEMGMPTDRDIVDGAPSLADGAATAEYLNDFGEQAHDLVHYCGSGGELAKDVIPGSGADYCIQAADAKMDALQHALELGEAVRQHQEIMKQYEDGSITLRQRDARGAPSLMEGAAAADAFLQVEYNSDQLVAYCR